MADTKIRSWKDFSEADLAHLKWVYQGDFMDEESCPLSEAIVVVQNWHEKGCPDDTE